MILSKGKNTFFNGYWLWVIGYRMATAPKFFLMQLPGKDEWKLFVVPIFFIFAN
jgi:hypothetical protein